MYISVNSSKEDINIWQSNYKKFGSADQVISRLISLIFASES